MTKLQVHPQAVPFQPALHHSLYWLHQSTCCSCRWPPTAVCAPAISCSTWLHINLLPHPRYRSLLSNVAQHTTSSRTCTPPFPKWFLSNSNSSIHPTGSSQNLPPEPERKIRSFYVAIIIPFLSLQSKSIKIQHSLAISGTCHFGDYDLKWLMIHPGGSATTCSHKQKICHRIHYSNAVCST